ncbi:MAG: DUF2336 domain-containing protein [Inquilinus sp.]|nr:DUF2336 domain-containing protein [Inquilinus sp.]
MSSNLTPEDVSKLLTDKSADARAEMVAKLAGDLDSNALTEQERQIAGDIVRKMAADAAVLVREAVARNLKSSRNLPHDVALSLANDVDQVALPVLEFSTVLEDGELAELLERAPECKQVAVARRETVSEALSQALVEHGSQSAVETLVGNAGARIDEKSFERALDRFGESETLQENIVKRETLPLTISERLVTMVSEQLQDYLVANHDLAPDTASDLILRARERATVSLVTDASDDKDVEKLARQLNAHGRLTASMILRSLCMGDLAFFEAALAELGGVPLLNARLLVHDEGGLGLKRLYEKAKLPASLFAAFRTAVDVNRQTDFRSADYDRETYSRIMIERILTQYDGMGAEDSDFLLRKLDDLMEGVAA